MIEAVVEKIDVKQALLAELETVLAPEAVLATNTSSLSVGAIARGLTRPNRLLGLHFFNPAPVMKLVELIGHDGTDLSALTRARDLTEAAGKTVIACLDSPGFIVNRCARPFYGEALALLEEGHDPAAIDAAMQAAGYRLGPFGLIDLVGADINLAATESLAAAMGAIRAITSLPRCGSGRLGRAGAQGRARLRDAPTPVAPPPEAAQIVERIEAALINEAAWLVSEGGVSRRGSIRR
ncbi:3-hydroxyacyl-CoA dehydrogenase family protein [Gemmobacter lanyuensis]